MAEQKLTLVEMEERLANDPQGVYRDQLVARFDGALAEVKRAVDGGLAPADFEAAERIQTALRTANAVVKKVWAAENGG